MSFKTTYKGIKGYAEASKGNWEAAEENLAWAYDNGLTKPAYLTAYGAALMRKGDFQKCLEVYERAYKYVEDGSTFIPSIKCSIITCKYKLDQGENALAEIKELYDEYKSSTVYMLYGYLLMKQAKLEEALKINLEGYEYDSEDVAVLDNLGQNYYLMGDIENAKIYFHKALKVKYNMVDSCYFLAEIYIGEGNLKKAYDLLDDIKDAPFSALTTVTHEQINEKYALVEKMMNESVI